MGKIKVNIYGGTLGNKLLGDAFHKHIMRHVMYRC